MRPGILTPDGLGVHFECVCDTRIEGSRDQGLSRGTEIIGTGQRPRRDPNRHRYDVHHVSSSFLGPVDPSFRALSGRLEFTVQRHQFNKESLNPLCKRFLDRKPTSLDRKPPSFAYTVNQRLLQEIL